MRSFLNKMMQPWIYIACWLVFYLASMLCYVYRLPALSIIRIVLLVWGAAIFIYQCFAKRRLAVEKRQRFLLLHLVFYCLTIVLNYRYNLIGNLTDLLFTWILYYVIFNAFLDETAENSRKQLSWLLRIVVVFSSIATIASLVMFFARYGKMVSFDDGTNMCIGFYRNRLYGVYVSVNHGAQLSTCAILAALFLWVNGKRKKVRGVLYTLSIVLQVFFIVLSDSRGAMLSSFVPCFLLAFAALLNLMVRKKITTRGWLRYAIALGCGVLAIGIWLGVTNFSGIVSKFSSQIVSEKITKQEQPEVVIGREEYETVTTLDEYSNQRFAIWGDAWRIVKERPVFGSTYRNFRIYAKDISPDGIIARLGATLHNGYVTLLVSSGILGSLPALIFLFGVAGKGIKRFFVRKSRGDGSHDILFSMMVMIAVQLVVITGVFWSNNFITVFFWAVCGYYNRVYLEPQIVLIEPLRLKSKHAGKE